MTGTTIPGSGCGSFDEMVAELAAGPAEYRLLLAFLGIARPARDRQEDELQALLVTDRPLAEVKDLEALEGLAADSRAPAWEYVLVGPLCLPDGSLPDGEEAALHLQHLALRVMEGRQLDHYLAFDRSGRRLTGGP